MVVRVITADENSDPAGIPVDIDNLKLFGLFPETDEQPDEPAPGNSTE